MKRTTAITAAAISLVTAFSQCNYTSLEEGMAIASEKFFVTDVGYVTVKFIRSQQETITRFHAYVDSVHYQTAKDTVRFTEMRDDVLELRGTIPLQVMGAEAPTLIKFYKDGRVHVYEPLQSVQKNVLLDAQCVRNANLAPGIADRAMQVQPMVLGAGDLLMKSGMEKNASFIVGVAASVIGGLLISSSDEDKTLGYGVLGVGLAVSVGFNIAANGKTIRAGSILRDRGI